MDVQQLRQDLAPYFVSYDSSRYLGRFTSNPLSANVPGGLQSGDWGMRSDLGRQVHYDGSRWVSEPYALPWITYTTLQGITTDNSTPFAAPLPPEYDIYLSVWRCSFVYVATTNNGSNYWTVKLRIEGASITDIASFNTSGMTVNTYSQHTAVSSFITNPVTNGAKTLSITVVKTGSPGALYLTPYLRVFDIIT